MAAAVASTSMDVSINHAFRTLGTVKALKHDLDKDYFDDMEQIFERAMQDVTERTSKLLCSLGTRTCSPNIKVLKKIIDMVPSSLKLRRNEVDTIPVHEASTSGRNKNSFQYVLPLVKAAIEHNVFEEDERGGLLVDDPTLERNALQDLAIEGQVDTMKELRANNLLMKKDIIAEDLIFYATYSGCEDTLNYLLDLDPDALNANLCKGNDRGLPISHAIIKDGASISYFCVLARIAMKHHRCDIGLIFQKDTDGKTAIGRAIDISGEEETFDALNKHLIPFIDPAEVPILHHCAKDAPQLMNSFAKYYPSAIFLRDRYGRTLRQAELANGTKTFANNALFFVNMTDADLRVADPNDDLYPFMMAASRMDTTCIDTAANQTDNNDADLNNDTNSDVLTPQIPRCDLTAVYYMIKRDPSLVYGGKRVWNNRKRKIENVL